MHKRDPEGKDQKEERDYYLERNASLERLDLLVEGDVMLIWS
jgi:hypothetical protein